MAAASLAGVRYGSSAALAAQASPAMSSVVLTPVSAASPPPATMNSELLTGLRRLWSACRGGRCRLDRYELPQSRREAAWWFAMS